MSRREPNLSIDADATNPGHFFACMGLLELAHRLWPSAEGWFSDNRFHVTCGDPAASLHTLVQHLKEAELEVSDEADTDEKTCPLRLEPLSLLLDWWRTDPGSALKTWAGQQKVTVIAKAMLGAATRMEVDAGWLNMGTVVQDPHRKKPVEPFYFDARRFSHSLDAGFSLDTVGAETLAHPAVEVLALIGLQRFRPRPTDERRTFEYCTWQRPLNVMAATGVASGTVPTTTGSTYHFPLKFRDDQKRYKAFGRAHRTGGTP